MGRISIDRTKPFPIKILGEGWRIAEEDERALTLKEVDLSRVFFETCLEAREFCVTGEEQLRRLKANSLRTRLDAKIFQTIWENQNLIPES